MKLTKRQREVSERLIDGMTIAAIAEDLALTESRVNQIIRALKNRFEVDTQAGIVAAYQRLGVAQTDIGDTTETGTDTGTGLRADPNAGDEGTGSQSLVPEILNTPHPILYRLVAICAAALLLAGALFLLAAFTVRTSEAVEGEVRIAPAAGVTN